MKRGMVWFVVGTLAMLGGPFFCLRAADSLGATSASTTLWAVFAIGGALASAVIMRVSAISPWGRTPASLPIICAAIASALVLALSFAAPRGGFGFYSHSVLAIATACTVAAAAVVATLLQRDRSETTRVDVVLLSLVLTFVFPATLFAIPALASTRGGALGTVLALGSVVVVGFVTQAVLTVRQPWTSAAGPLVLSLLLLQGRFVSAASDKPLGYKVGFYVGAVGFLWCLGRIGAGIASRVYASRFDAVGPDLPAAHVEQSSS